MPGISRVGDCDLLEQQRRRRESVVPLDQRPTICNAVDGGFLCVPRGIDQILFLPPRSENRTNTESVSPYGEKRGEIQTQFDLTGAHHGWIWNRGKDLWALSLPALLVL